LDLYIDGYVKYLDKDPGQNIYVPLPHVKVELWRHNIAKVGECWTDESGFYTFNFTNLPQDNYYVRVRTANVATSIKNGNYFTPQIWIPLLTDINWHKNIKIDPSQENGQEY
jgi:hypothetical protein